MRWLATCNLQVVGNENKEQNEKKKRVGKDKIFVPFVIFCIGNF